MPPGANLHHGAATMDTLVSMGVLAAFAWSPSLLQEAAPSLAEKGCRYACAMAEVWRWLIPSR